MIQRINLLNAIPKKTVNYYSGAYLVRYVGVFVGALFMYSLFLLLDCYYLKRNISRLNEKNIQLVALLTEASTRPDFIHLTEKKKELTVIDNQLLLKQQLIVLLSNKTLFNTTGFSPVMEGLAKAIVKGMWLTRITLQKGGAVIALSGQTVSSALVPTFVKNLESNPAFAHIAFNIETINDNTKDTSDYSSFLIKGVLES